MSGGRSVHEMRGATSGGTGPQGVLDRPCGAAAGWGMASDVARSDKRPVSGLGMRHNPPGEMDTIRAEMLTDAGTPPLSSYLSHSSFLTPNRLLPESAWLEHAPFAFWLVEVLRPKQLVELGCSSGFSYSVFCQAVQAFGLDTRCCAVDSWLGDEQSGFYGPDVFTTFNAYNEAHFGSFSQLIRADFDEALQYFSDGSIDLLHLDGRHTYDAVKSDYGNWRSKLSERGVVLFHDTNVRERGFGVARLWQELSREHKHFEFLHGHGLGVLGVGANLPPALELLFRREADSALVQQVRHVYSRLGQSVADAARRPVLQARIQELEAQPLPDASARDHAARMARLEAELGRQIKRHNYLAATASQRTAEVETLTQQLGTARTELAAAAADGPALAAAQAHNRHLQDQLDRLHRSTSWRITRPLRGIATRLRWWTRSA
jgi:O-antigen biosynthesis protein